MVSSSCLLWTRTFSGQAQALADVGAGTSLHEQLQDLVLAFGETVAPGDVVDGLGQGRRRLGPVAAGGGAVLRDRLDGLHLVLGYGRLTQTLANQDVRSAGWQEVRGIRMSAEAGSPERRWIS